MNMRGGMAYSTATGGARRPVPTRVPTAPLGEEGVRADLALACATRVNVLLVGPESSVADLVTALVPDLASANLISCQPSRFHLPAASAPPRALVVFDVDVLNRDGQRTLLDWLSAQRAKVQVISTSSRSPLRLVKAGFFDPALYYRLNTVYIDLCAARRPQAAEAGALSTI